MISIYSYKAIQGIHFKVILAMYLATYIIHISLQSNLKVKVLTSHFFNV